MTTTAHIADRDARAPGAGLNVTDIKGYDRGTGTGEPTESVAHLLRLMKGADDTYNSRDYDFFLDKRHSEDVAVHYIGAPSTVGRPAHRTDMENYIKSFPDMRVLNDPYDVQFGQGEWTVALGKLAGTFTQPLPLPDGSVVEPTGKSFLIFFTTIARWQNDQMVDEYVLFDQQDLVRQVTASD